MSAAPRTLAAGTATAHSPPASDSLHITSARLDARTGVLVFLAFAAAYFCSALVRAITATLSPVLTQEFSMQSRDLGLLAGGYFLGFSAMQLPLGTWLDRFGPKRVILCFLAVSVAGCLAFSMATSFSGLLAARVLVGMGVSACLMAPLTGYRRWFETATQLRANSWMLMTGSLGMLASTLPVQWLLPLTGWRPLFWILAGMVLLSMAVIAWVVPLWRVEADSASPAPVAVAGSAADKGYGPVWRHRFFWRMTPLAIFNYGGLVSIQTLWAGPWMVKVAGYTPLEAATGLFWINAIMLVTFWSWGMLNPVFVRKGWGTTRLLAWGMPLSMLVLAGNILLGAECGWIGWALFCMASSVLGLAQPAVAMAFPPSLAGRALSAYNLMIFGGVFIVQWSIGLLIDLFRGAGMTEPDGFRVAMAMFLCCCIASYAYFMFSKADNSPQ